MVNTIPKLKLHGFNNLTKSLGFCIYDINYTKTTANQQEYLAYVEEQYNADRLTDILLDVCKIIGAEPLNIARQDYDPHGASVTIMVSEQEMAEADRFEESERPGPMPSSVVSHLDKSHICVHTYPESHPDSAISTFRADIEVATCGVISPLKALNFLIHSFESDIVTLDYRIRGFTRDIDGRKHYIDHQINSIQNFLTQDTTDAYQMVDANLYQENIFHTKMMRKSFALKDYLVGGRINELSSEQQTQITQQLQKEMNEIFYGRNLPE